ncbi:C_GCAxxG_C_C family protein [Candidatus Bathyarchaeota archaeon]|nr:C_GCAxxG_C_C family protein [Candidatus Bathyarchaeota archaeon]
MSFKLKDIQDIAEIKGRDYFMNKKYDCNIATLLAVSDALKGVDEINYADPLVIKAINPLSAGLGTWEGPCGAVAAGSALIGLKYGTSDPNNQQQ